jgi:hypothetical protein
MPNPNVQFVSGAIYTAAQANRLPRGIMAYATSDTAQNLSLTSTIATGMTVTFTAETGRLYLITYLEPEVQTPSVAAGNTICTIKLTNAAATAYAVSTLQTPSAAKTVNQVTTMTVQSFATAGSKVIVGACSTSSLTGTPTLERTATRLALIMVEDIGPT